MRRRRRFSATSPRHRLRRISTTRSVTCGKSSRHRGNAAGGAGARATDDHWSRAPTRAMADGVPRSRRAREEWKSTRGSFRLRRRKVVSGSNPVDLSRSGAIGDSTEARELLEPRCGKVGTFELPYEHVVDAVAEK